MCRMTMLLLRCQCLDHRNYIRSLPNNSSATLQTFGTQLKQIIYAVVQNETYCVRNGKLAGSCSALLFHPHVLQTFFLSDWRSCAVPTLWRCRTKVLEELRDEPEKRCGCRLPCKLVITMYFLIITSPPCPKGIHITPWFIQSHYTTGSESYKYLIIIWLAHIATFFFSTWFNKGGQIPSHNISFWLAFNGVSSKQPGQFI